MKFFTIAMDRIFDWLDTIRERFILPITKIGPDGDVK